MYVITDKSFDTLLSAVHTNSNGTQCYQSCYHVNGALKFNSQEEAQRFVDTLERPYWWNIKPANEF